MGHIIYIKRGRTKSFKNPGSQIENRRLLFYTNTDREIGRYPMLCKSTLILACYVYCVCCADVLTALIRHFLLDGLGDSQDSELYRQNNLRPDARADAGTTEPRRPSLHRARFHSRSFSQDALYFWTYQVSWPPRSHSA